MSAHAMTTEQDVHKWIDKLASTAAFAGSHEDRTRAQRSMAALRELINTPAPPADGDELIEDALDFIEHGTMAPQRRKQLQALAARAAAVERARALAVQHRSIEQHNEMVPMSDIADLIREPSSADYLAALDAPSVERNATEDILALSTRQDTHRRADCFALGTPDGFAQHEEDAPEVRPRLVLDDLIEDTISRLPHASRLYPEVYAWKVSDEIAAALRGEN